MSSLTDSSKTSSSPSPSSSSSRQIARQSVPVSRRQAAYRSPNLAPYSAYLTRIE